LGYHNSNGVACIARQITILTKLKKCKGMKKKSTILLLIGLLLIVASYFVMRHEVTTELDQEPEEVEEEPEEVEEEPEPKPRAKKAKPETVTPAQIIEPKPNQGNNENAGE